MRLPYSPPHPGELLLEDFLTPMGMTQMDFAKHIGVSFKRINEIVNGKRGITPETALLFSQAFGNAPQFWLNVQNTYDLAHVKVEKKIVRLQTVFHLSPAKYKQFMKILDKPPSENPKLRKLLSKKSGWQA